VVIMTDLKTCPFCGQPPRVAKSDAELLWCPNSSCANYCRAFMRTDWNTRAEPSGTASDSETGEPKGGEAVAAAMRITIIDSGNGLQAIRNWENIGELPAGDYMLFTHPPRATAVEVNEAYARGRNDGWEAHAAKVSTTAVADARGIERYRWWRENLHLMNSDEGGIHGIAYSLQIPWPFIERATVGELADAIADAALSAQRGEVK
jgi:hypothetical protein